MTPPRGLRLDPPFPVRTGEPATARQTRLLRKLATATGEVEREQIDGLTHPEANALIRRILDRHPEEARKTREERRRKARASGGLSVWAMDLEQRR